MNVRSIISVKISFFHFFPQKNLKMMNKTETKSPRPPPMLNLNFRTPRKMPNSPQTTRNSRPSTSKGNKNNLLAPLTARPNIPDNLFEQSNPNFSQSVQNESEYVSTSKNPRFRFFIPPTYQVKNLPLRISPVVPNAPISPQEAIEKYSTLLTPFEVTEILDFPDIYFVGFKNKKNDINLSDSAGFGLDDHTTGYYKAQKGDHIIYRFEIQSLIGQGKHGQVFKCFDHREHQLNAVKILANNERTEVQSKVEMTILSRLKKLHPENIETAQIYFQFRNHIFVTFNILSKNLVQIMKLNTVNSLPPRLVKSVAIDVINQLKEIYSVGVTIHGQITPENVLLVPNTNAEFKLIDFSNSILENNIPDNYQVEVPRCYRPPETIVGMPPTPAFDMWCLGCLLFQLTTGKVLFEAKDDIGQLWAVSEVIGAPEESFKKKIPRRPDFIDRKTGTFYKTPLNQPRKEGSVPIRQALGGDFAGLADFLRLIFVWDPDNRLTIEQALEHPYITETESRLPELVKNPA
ncbi:Dual specificity tyrosine-phosphorylation-regulated kinase 4 [Tritrichomonas foetus]|uniref:dual-specificity kinase n=1 Tax=Tritrichomonas foetus TaxID=1144522 RepID=A0A1J4KQU3_9EUKA|nr:Dual specificity tyrosine-phosphorylation-regulated kinase 4 [Tritrichomonas foetus]|eukprot:OHT13466.1 Dual specificity tyrosine-phosphorylation-regulated kinase 4 [Tritrichomonas foetus]